MMASKVNKTSPGSKASKKDAKTKTPKVAKVAKGKDAKAETKQPKTKKELIPINEVFDDWTVKLDIQTGKDGRVKYPVKGEGKIPLLNGAKVDNGHGKKQSFLGFVIDGFTPVKGGDDDYNIRMHRSETLRAAQKDVVLSKLRKEIKGRVREINNKVSEQEKATQAAIRKSDKEDKASKLEKEKVAKDKLAAKEKVAKDKAKAKEKALKKGSPGKASKK